MKQINNITKIDDHVVLNLISLLSFIEFNKYKLIIDMGHYKKNTDDYDICKSSCCLIGHAFHQGIGLDGEKDYHFYTLNKKINYSRYCDDIFINDIYNFKSLFIRNYLFSAWNSNVIYEAIIRINNVLYSDYHDLKSHYNKVMDDNLKVMGSRLF
jgi:hypothetical protein